MLDEPMDGLDNKSKIKIWNLLSVNIIHLLVFYRRTLFIYQVKIIAGYAYRSYNHNKHE